MRKITFDDLVWKPWLVPGRKYATAWIEEESSFILWIKESAEKGKYNIVHSSNKCVHGLTKEQVTDYLIKYREETLASGTYQASLRRRRNEKKE